jgi:hypothetical protein
VGRTGFLELLLYDASCRQAEKECGQPDDEKNAVDDFVCLVFKRTDSINAGGGDPPIPLLLLVLLLFPPGLLVDLFLPRCPPPRPPGCGGGADMFVVVLLLLLRCCVRFRSMLLM